MKVKRSVSAVISIFLFVISIPISIPCNAWSLSSDNMSTHIVIIMRDTRRFVDNYTENVIKTLPDIIFDQKADGNSIKYNNNYDYISLVFASLNREEPRSLGCTRPIIIASSPDAGNAYIYESILERLFFTDNRIFAKQLTKQQLEKLLADWLINKERTKRCAVMGGQFSPGGDFSVDLVSKTILRYLDILKNSEIKIPDRFFIRDTIVIVVDTHDFKKRDFKLETVKRLLSRELSLIDFEIEALNKNFGP